MQIRSNLEEQARRLGDLCCAGILVQQPEDLCQQALQAARVMTCQQCQPQANNVEPALARKLTDSATCAALAYCSGNRNLFGKQGLLAW